MSKVTKIDGVYLYTSGTLSTEEELATKKLLDDSGIPYTHLEYNEPKQHPSIFSALSTWYWGVDRANRNFDRFPLVHWKEYYDDLYPMDFNAVGLQELKDSSLLKNKTVVV